MKLNYVYYISVAFLVLFSSCTTGTKNMAPEYGVSPLKPYKNYSGKKLKIPVKENIRELPNGEIIGESRKNEEFLIVERRGNWFRIKNEDFTDGFIWAPSFGVEKIDMNALATWYDTENRAFYSPDQYENFLGGYSEKTDHFGLKRLNYYDIGLGREVETEMDQLGHSKKIVVKKGAGLVFSADGVIIEIILDLKKKLKNEKMLENLLWVELGNPDLSDDSRVVWKNRFGLKEIDLFRDEYKSDSFNQIALIR